MASDRQLLDLVGVLYDCAVDPQRWSDALGQVVTMVGATGSTITLLSPERREQEPLAEWGFKPEFRDAMLAGNGINPVLASAWHIDIDQAFTGIGLLGRDAYYNCRFYREIVGKWGYCDAASTVISKSAEISSGWTVAHSSAQGEWSDAQVDEIRTLAPHMRRAVTISNLLGVRALKEDMLTAATDMLTVGIVMVDRAGRIAHVNRAGDRMIRERGALRRDGDYLSARDPRDAQALLSAITTAASGDIVNLPRSGIAVPVRGEHGQDLAVWVLPLDKGLRSDIGAPFSAVVAVFVREVGDTSPFSGELFVKRYKLTAAECRVLMMLTQGMTPTETADCLGSSLATVKTHMARLFEKTGTRGQAELMRLAVSALAPARG